MANKVSPKSYQTVNAENVERYIHEHYDAIGKLIFNDKHKMLRDCNKAELNAIAAELETIVKRLEWIIEGKY